jgi:hypothetical protein
LPSPAFTVHLDVASQEAAAKVPGGKGLAALATSDESVVWYVVWYDEQNTTIEKADVEVTQLSSYIVMSCSCPAKLEMQQCHEKSAKPIWKRDSSGAGKMACTAARCVHQRARM